MERSYVQVIWKGQSHTVFPKWTVLYVMILCCLILASGMIPGRLSPVIFNNVPGRNTGCNKLHLLFLALAKQGERARERKTDRHVGLALGCLQVCCGNESIDLDTRLKLAVALWVSGAFWRLIGQQNTFLSNCPRSLTGAKHWPQGH